VFGDKRSIRHSHTRQDEHQPPFEPLGRAQVIQPSSAKPSQWMQEHPQQRQANAREMLDSHGDGAQIIVARVILVRGDLETQ
jgi:hypothetical protein